MTYWKAKARVQVSDTRTDDQKGTGTHDCGSVHAAAAARLLTPRLLLPFCWPQDEVRRTIAADATASAPTHAALVQQIRRALSQPMRGGSGGGGGGVGVGVGVIGADLRRLACKLHDDHQSELRLQREQSADPRPQLPLPPDQLDHIFEARVEWEKRLRFELRAVANKQGRKLVELRDPARIGGSGAAAAAAAAAAAGAHSAAGCSYGVTACAAVTDPLPDDFQVRFVYTADDLLEVVAALRNPNRAPSIPPPLGGAGGRGAALPPQPPLGWGMVQLDLSAPRMDELAVRYASLSPSVRQVGVDDAVLGLEWFGAERRATGEELLAAAAAATTPAAAASATAALHAYARTGVPAALRPAIWARMLGVPLPLPASYQSRYAQLLSRVERWKLLTDDLALFDVADGPANDEAFFVFAEQLGEVALVFSRDDSVHADSSVLLSAAPLCAQPNDKLRQKIESHAQITGQDVDFVRLEACGRWGMGTRAPAACIDLAASLSVEASSHSSPLVVCAVYVHMPPSIFCVPASLCPSPRPSPPLPSCAVQPTSIPPNRVIPFHRLSYLSSPFCFLYASTPEMYFAFRAMWTRLLCRVATLTSADEGAVQLAHAFESMLAARAPKLVYHMAQMGVRPLQCGAFGWIVGGFAGALDVEQVLLLWDRLLAHQSLQLLPVLAAAIFTWRSRSIMAARSADEVHQLMRQLANLKVVPLLQHFLFHDAPGL